jgi:hypothetical protein
LPILLASEEATRVDPAATALVAKKTVPSWPSGRLNLPRKKYVSQDSEANPEANESSPNRINRRITRDHKFLSIDANRPRRGAGSSPSAGASPSSGRVSAFGACSSSSFTSTSRVKARARTSLTRPTAL